MYDEAMRHVANAEPRGWVRSFDNRYYVKQAITGVPAARKAYHLDEFTWLAGVARQPLKVPITGPYTLMDWSYDEHYARTDGSDLFGSAGRRRKARARRELALDLARNVIRPNLEALISAGARRVQIDEPAATTVPEEVPVVVEAFNEAVRGLDADFSIHVCFSDYSLLFPHILELEGCAEFALEFANDDLWTRGTGHDERPGYAILRTFADHDAPFRIGVGVTDIHTDRLESTELVADRLEYAVRTLGDPASVAANPDCGLRTRSWDVSEAKLATIVEATRIVRGAFGAEAEAITGSP